MRKARVVVTVMSFKSLEYALYVSSLANSSVPVVTDILMNRFTLSVDV
jgi:hypothetical protein